RLLSGSLVGQCIALTYCSTHECQFVAADALIAESGDLVDELPHRIGGAVGADAGRGRVRPGMLSAVEEAARAVGIALVFTQIQVDAAVEGTTQHIIHQRAAEVFAGGIPWHVSNVAD